MTKDPADMDINELREALFATSRRLSELRSEYAKRERARHKAEKAEFDGWMKALLRGDDRQMVDGSQSEKTREGDS